MKIYRTKLPSSIDVEINDAEPGEILVSERSDKIYAVCTDLNLVQILELQIEGKRKLSAEEFLRGFKLKSGDKFTVLDANELKAFLKNKKD